ncbi:hypothetical protein, partial [Burkholderia pseudomallei]|uniref:hypothetical protein n=1 Tax=Burkholderia pseudomallei TaxID=28450 RepID=UPI00057294C6
MRVDRCLIGTWSNRRRDATRRRFAARPHDRTTARQHDNTRQRICTSGFEPGFSTPPGGAPAGGPP